MTVFTGSSGQDKYELTLKFGNKSLSKYAKDLPIVDCLTKTGNNNWFSIDIEKRKFFIQLD